MQDNDRRERALFRTALQPTPHCPTTGELESALTGPDSAILAHAESCAFCAAELKLLKTFLAAEVSAEDEHAVRLITERLANRPVLSPVKPKPWWQNVFAGSPMRQAAFVMAGILVIVGIGLEVRHNARPELDGTTGGEVFRSSSVALMEPRGDVSKAPTDIRWQTAKSAAAYEVRLLEVDHNELWKARTTEASVRLPEDVRALIVPRKTLLLQVIAFDREGRKVAESEVVPFRVLQ